jgi:FlaA1/EpsC-like NDP-sugar epimerase
MASYATNAEVARGYVVLALPSMTLFGILGRYWLRKRLYRLRSSGGCMRKTLVAGPPRVVADLINVLRSETRHGLQIVGACLTGPPGRQLIAGVPVLGGIQDITDAASATSAETVTVLACPELAGVRLRALAWELEKTGADLCVAPALLDVAGRNHRADGKPGE